jgi:hypothetical protein
MKKIVAVLIAALLFIPATVALAAPVTKDPAQKAKIQEFKNFITSQRAQIKVNRQNNQSLRGVIKVKHQEIKAKVQELKQKNDDNSKVVLTGLKDNRNEVKATREQLVGLKGKVKAEFANLKVNKENKNIEGAKQNIENIISIQQQRNRLLSELSSKLDVILEQLR